MPTGPRINPQTDAVGLSGFAEIAALEVHRWSHLPPGVLLGRRRLSRELRVPQGTALN